MPHKKMFSALSVCVALLLICSAYTLLSAPQSRRTLEVFGTQRSDTGGFVLEIYDAQTRTPIEHVSVTVVSDHQTCFSDSEGKTQRILPTGSGNEVTGWGRTDLCITAQDYPPHLLYNVWFPLDRVRNGPDVFLEQASRPVILHDTPPEALCEEIIRQFS